MSLILVKVVRKGARHYTPDGGCYGTGHPFLMEEDAFLNAPVGLFERAEAPLEQIKSKELPPGEPATGPAVAAVEEPKEPEEPGEPAGKGSKKLSLKQK